jgi:hypothetical protein
MVSYRNGVLEAEQKLAATLCCVSQSLTVAVYTLPYLAVGNFRHSLSPVRAAHLLLAFEIGIVAA